MLANEEVCEIVLIISSSTDYELYSIIHKFIFKGKDEKILQFSKVLVLTKFN